ncbi:hormogonium polysaccharide biosynthesis protein HpsA [Leptothoe sp. ISB3NOV94-8A]
MSTPKRSRVSNLRRSLTHVRQLPKHFMAWLLRLIFAGARFSRPSQAGFILPTTVMLLLVLTLTVGGLSFRSFSRLNQTVAYREQQRIDNFAAPAVDRARAKIEYLFTKDRDIVDKRPPSSADLINAILRYSRPVLDGGDGKTWGDAKQIEDDPYTLPDEEQLDINPDTDPGPDPAWRFRDPDGNIVIYSLLTSHEARDTSGTLINDSDGNPLTLTSNKNQDKADNLVTRNGPINTQKSAEGCPVTAFSGDGWQDAGGSLQKVFQIDVLNIANPNSPNRTVSSAEYQQVRSTPKGNKYGAWFRYDMEIFPGGNFRWNGAMHSESNIIASDKLEAYLVSSPESCIFSTDASEITLSVSGYDTNGDGNDDQFFQGHLVSGASKDDSFGGGTDFHEENNANPAKPGEDKLRKNTDSVNETGAAALTDVAVDPVLILTEDRTVNLNPATWDPEAAKDITPIINDTEAIRDINVLDESTRVRLFPDASRPFVDDGFRADNRYGPKPVYDSRNSLLMKDGALFSDLGESDKLIGQPIVNHDSLAIDNSDEQEFGLDGYWERRSIIQGLRVVVGQRLELGNRFGWAPNNDPLYPPTAVQAIMDGGREMKGPARAKQQRSLRDNLAAVQGMVVYHHTFEDGKLPYMCMASTVHPGTEQTLIDSRTFGTYPLKTVAAGTPKTRIDFLTGQGTNGWEFDFQTKYPSVDDFASNINSTRPLGRALHNLAHFAGDPWGGAPSFEPVQGEQNEPLDAVLERNDDVVHPYPYLAMWGDFSILRRILFEHDFTNSTETPLVETINNFKALSPADQSTIHSAACMLGMLANNLEDLKDEYSELIDPAIEPTLLSDIDTALAGVGVTDGDKARKWLRDLEAAGSLLPDELEKAKVIALYRQVVRDRTYGFESGPGTVPADCATDLPPNLVRAFCSTGQDAAYPSLYYIFPVASHNQDGSVVAGGAGTVIQADEYIDESVVNANERYIFDPDASSFRVNDNVTYEVVAGPAPASPDSLAQIRLFPKTSAANFEQPTATVAGGTLTSRDDLQKNIIDSNGTITELAFLDKGMMDGRELLNIRVLDLDIDKLTDITADPRSYFTVGTDQIAWIPEVDGIFYAAREDAVREDSIVRPRQDTWANCQDFDDLQTGNCTMVVENPTNASQKGTFDPPLAPNLISPKPVDMYADPDRRPYGFRVINGSIIHRSGDDKAAGVTFVTDNPAYVYGDFNLHQDTAGAILEEFEGVDELGNIMAVDPDPFDRFYNRKRENLNQKFARGGEDLWRPSEIFADAVSILSSEFRDGVIEDAYRYRNDEEEATAPDGILSSYLNSDRPDVDVPLRLVANAWQREDLEGDPALADTDLPMRFDRNGIPYRLEAGTYQPFSTGFAGDLDHFTLDEDAQRRNNLIPAADNTRVNALLVAGIVPLRSAQNYGGFHNFPRLIEYWPAKNLFISGGFFQLNFSTQATAPFDQDAWEPGATSTAAGPPANGVFNSFYGNAVRIWGYDVGFQYTSVAPIARRFIAFGRPRSEFYRELPLNDAYIANLCTAEDSTGAAVLTDVGCQN